MSAFDQSRHERVFLFDAFMIPGTAIAGAKNGRGYRQIRIDGRPYSASRLAWLYMTRKWPNSEISYFNGKPSDTRWANLREATSSPRNRPKRK
jgi:HNH endonuclease